MSRHTLFVAWQDKRPTSRQWFPVGRLDVEPQGVYRFQYIQGVLRAGEESGFAPLLAFRDLHRVYRSRELFGLFRNRVMAKGRPDRLEYLECHDLPGDADPFEILSVNGGNRITDTYEVFPLIRTDADGTFVCRFFVHGWRHVDGADARIDALICGDELRVAVEYDNPVTGRAVQIRQRDGRLLGWTPRYLVNDLIEGGADSTNHDGGRSQVTESTDMSDMYTARVVRVNRVPAGSAQRLLVELTGCWSRHKPMSGEDFKLLGKEVHA